VTIGQWGRPPSNGHILLSGASPLANNGIGEWTGTGQAEPSSLSDTVLEEDWDPDDNGDGDAPSMDTRFAHQISDSEHGRLKRRFLDYLAEFAANKKGGTAVACSAMKEAEDNVVIWIARNEGFSDVDRPTFDKLGKVLGSLSCNSGTSCVTALFLRT
jgi:hypothetical protein